MAVETKYVVVRKGEEKMTFASKKEADAHDKLLDMAEAFTDWLLQSGMQMDETQAEDLGLYLAEQKDAVQHILRTSKLRLLIPLLTIKPSQVQLTVKKSGRLKRPDGHIIIPVARSAVVTHRRPLVTH
jgi:dsDNA-binding SOS-regulon protein